MKRTEPEHISTLIEKMLRMAGAEAKIDAHTAELAWPEVVGAAIAKATTACMVRDRVMHVFVASAPLKEELNYIRNSLVEKINTRVGATVVEALVVH